MHEEQLREEPELADGVVRGREGLGALTPIDADADVGGLDHAHVVGAVADGERALLGARLHELDQLGLVLGRGAAADDRAAGGGQRQEVLLDVGGEEGGERL